VAWGETANAEEEEGWKLPFKDLLEAEKPRSRAL